MVDFSRYGLFSSLVDSDKLIPLKERECINNLLKINAELLQDVEESYTSKGQSVLDILIRNANACWESGQKCFDDKAYDGYLAFLNTWQSSDQEDSGYLLAQAIRKLAKCNNAILDKVLMHENIPQEFLEKPAGWNQVFLSHAFEDKLYAFSLYLEFYQQGVYLYVDWMHNGALVSAIIKNALAKALDDSSQFLLLRTPNSELRVKGSTMIRGWCSWEMGYYHKKAGDRMFYLQQYNNSKDLPQNAQLSGLLRFSGNFKDGLMAE